jgi:hypothetical protein
VLVLRYARMAKPPLASEKVLIIFVSALTKVNFVEAWNHQRTYEDDLRKNLLKVIFCAILSREYRISNTLSDSYGCC